MGPETLAALVGAGVGALASGAVSVALQIQGQRRADRQEKARERMSDRASLEAAFMAVQERASTARHFADHVQAANVKVRAGQPLWQVLIGFANHPPSVELPSGDLAVFLRHSMGSLFNDVRDTINAHNAARQAWQRYGELRTEFGRAVPATMNGRRGVAELTQEDMNRVGPLVAEMGSVAEQMAKHAPVDARLSRETLIAVVEALEKVAGVRVEMVWEPRSD